MKVTLDLEALAEGAGITVAGRPRVSQPDISVKLEKMGDDRHEVCIRVDDDLNPEFWMELRVPVVNAGSDSNPPMDGIPADTVVRYEVEGSGRWDVNPDGGIVGVKSPPTSPNFSDEVALVDFYDRCRVVRPLFRIYADGRREQIRPFAAPKQPREPELEPALT